MKFVCNRVLSVMLAFAILFLLIPVSFAADTTAALYGVYGDGMLFKQNSEAFFAGTAQKNSLISCRLVSSDGVLVAEGEGKADSAGMFSVSFTAPAGGYQEYTATLFENGVVFAELHDIVFGELWLAGGQSNMALPLAGDLQGEQMQAEGESFSDWLRFLQTPSLPEYNGSSGIVPAVPQADLNDCKWVKGSEAAVYGSSAVAFYFAQRLQQTLDMPVGILQATLGASNISSWLPREAVDHNSEVKSILEKNGFYVEADDWEETEADIYTAVSACFNAKIAPLTCLRLSGMLWYQGENEVAYHFSYGEYTKQFDLLQQSYSALFGYDGMLPIVFTQLASYGYADDFRLQRFNIELAAIQNAHPESRALASIYDVPLTYKADVHAIHPLEKSEVGERMAFCAEGLVYGQHSCYTTATVENAVSTDTDIVITLKNTGDGLTSDGMRLKGFAICGGNGIYLPAEAEIISDNTVRVFNENVENPVSVTYAVSQYNGRSNLFAAEDGVLMPVSPFITDSSYTAHFWKDSGWTDCENAEIWRTHTNELTGFYDTWTAQNAVWKITRESAYSGDGGLAVTSDETVFSVSPVLKDESGALFLDIDGDFRDYSTLSFQVRNDGSSGILLECLRLQCGDAWYIPAAAGSVVSSTLKNASISQSIPADGNWYTVSFDLTALYSVETGELLEDSALVQKEIGGLQFCFVSEAGSATIHMDEFEFSTEKPSEHKKTFLDKIREFFEKILNFLKRIFGIR